MATVARRGRRRETAREEVAAATTPDTQRRGARRDLNPQERRKLMRRLATLEAGVTEQMVADEFMVTIASLKMFKQSYAREIDAIRGDLDNKFAGIWLADKEARLYAYAEEFIIARSNPNMSHHEWIKTRAAILRAVADELGQIPGRSGILVVPVEHVIVNIDLEDLK